ncbi:unnamed protein product [Anisakis simplex]|uniref:Uncharacterized protein n=1 Tax=Anisakis simplex TaxID=6269 RepID=A0A158PN36_ANISI|nr:unnamed protein product [Anisakis simplex]
MLGVFVFSASNELLYAYGNPELSSQMTKNSRIALISDRLCASTSSGVYSDGSSFEHGRCTPECELKHQLETTVSLIHSKPSCELCSTGMMNLEFNRRRNVELDITNYVLEGDDVHRNMPQLDTLSKELYASMGPISCLLFVERRFMGIKQVGMEDERKYLNLRMTAEVVNWTDLIDADGSLSGESVHQVIRNQGGINALGRTLLASLMPKQLTCSLRHSESPLQCIAAFESFVNKDLALKQTIRLASSIRKIIHNSLKYITS